MNARMRSPPPLPIILIPFSIMEQKTNTNSVFIFIFGFISGILVSSFLFISPILGTFIIFLGLVIFLVEKVWNREKIPPVLFCGRIMEKGFWLTRIYIVLSDMEIG